MEFITKSDEETREIGKKLARKFSGGEVLALVGELGDGKTTFTQGLAQGLGIKQRVISPTFILMRRYQIKSSKFFYHVDLYRLEENLGNEIENLGLTEFWGRSENIVAIEWAEKIKDLLPKNTIWITFKILEENTRRIVLDKHPTR